MTIRTIATAADMPNTDGIVKAWNLLNIGKHPGLDSDLQADQAELLLSYLAQPTTRRTPEKAAVFAGLLADLQSGNGQTRKAEPAKPEIVRHVAADKPTRQRTIKATVLQPVTAQQANTRRKAPSISQAFTNITLLDVVYLIALITACYGAWMGLGKSEMGISFGVVYLLVSLQALGMAKDPENRKTAVAGIVMVCALEVIAFFIDLSMFNLRTWEVAKLDRLPFRSYETNIPFVIAACLSGVYSGIRIYCVCVTFSLTHEQRKSAEHAKQAAERQAANVETLRAALEDSAHQWLYASGKNNFDTERAGVFAERYFTILKNTQ